MLEPVDAAQLAHEEVLKPKVDILHQFTERTLVASQKLRAIEEKRRVEGPSFGLENDVVTVLAGINDRKIVEKGDKVYWFGEMVHSAAKQIVLPTGFESGAHDNYAMMLGAVNSYPDAIVAVASSFGIALPVPEEPTSTDLSTLIFDYVHGTTNAQDGSAPRELPEGAIKGVDFVEVPTTMNGLACRLSSGNREGHTISLVLKPHIVEELYQGMYESGYIDPQGDGTSKMIGDLFPRSNAANSFIDARRTQRRP